MTELSFGYERSLMIRNYLQNLQGSDLGATPKGEDTNGVDGGVENGPTILPRLKLFVYGF